jgi:hypothetical protein
MVFRGKMMKLIKFLLLNSVLWASIYYGFFLNTQGAKNIVYFINALTLITGLGCLSESVRKSAKSEKDCVANKPIRTLLTSLEVLAYLWFSNFWLAGIASFGFLMIEHAREENDKNI